MKKEKINVSNESKEKVNELRSKAYLENLFYSLNNNVNFIDNKNKFMDKVFIIYLMKKGGFLVEKDNRIFLNEIEYKVFDYDEDYFTILNIILNKASIPEIIEMFNKFCLKEMYTILSGKFKEEKIKYVLKYEYFYKDKRIYFIENKITLEMLKALISNRKVMSDIECNYLQIFSQNNSSKFFRALIDVNNELYENEKLNFIFNILFQCIHEKELLSNCKIYRECIYTEGSKIVSNCIAKFGLNNFINFLKTANMEEIIKVLSIVAYMYGEGFSFNSNLDRYSKEDARKNIKLESIFESDEYIKCETSSQAFKIIMENNINFDNQLEEIVNKYRIKI